MAPTKSTTARLANAVQGVMKYIYWILGIIGVCVACYYLYNVMDRPVAGILVFISGILALYFYYVKWFVIPSLGKKWPPYQTTCPDYLTPVYPESGMAGSASGGVTCVDFVGVSRNSVLKKADPAMIQSQINQPQYTFSVNPKESPDSLKQRLLSYGLTWVSLFGEN